MIEIKTNDPGADLMRQQFTRKVVPSNPSYVVVHCFDKLSRSIRHHLTSISGPVYQGELEEYFLTPIASLIQRVYAEATKPSSADTSGGGFVQHEMIVKSVAYSLINEYISLSQAKTISNEMTLQLVENTPIFVALQTMNEKATTMIDSADNVNAQATAVNKALQLWLRTAQSTTTTNGVASRRFPNSVALTAPDNSSILAVASAFLSTSWKDEGEETTLSTKLDMSLNDYYQDVLKYAGRGKGFPLTRSKRSWRIDYLWSLYNTLLDAYDKVQAGVISFEDGILQDLLSVTYAFDWYLEQRSQETPLFPAMAFQVNSIGWAQTVRSLSRKLSDIWNTFSRVPLTFEFEFLISEVTDAMAFAKPFIGDYLWTQQIDAALSEAKTNASSALIPDVSNMISAARADYAALYPDADVVSNAILSQWITSSVITFKSKTKDMTPERMISEKYYNLASELLHANRDYVAIQIADMAIPLRSTAYFIANHMSLLALTKLDAIQPVPPITLDAIPAPVGTPSQPQVWDFTERGATSFITRKWKVSPKEKIYSSKWVLEDEALQLRPTLFSKIIANQLVDNSKLLPYFRDLQEVPLASPLTAEYFSQPIPWTYVAPWTRSKKSWNISKYLEMFNPKEAIPHSVEDKFLAAARLISNPARGMSQAIIDATAGTGTWYILPSDGNLFQQQITAVNTDRANRAKVSHSIIPDINASDLWRKVVSDPAAVLNIPEEVPIVIDDTLFYASDAADPSSGAPATDALVSTAPDDVRQMSIRSWYPMRPSVPFVYGVPTQAMMMANFIRPTAKGSGKTKTYDFSDMKNRAVIYQVVDPATNTPTTVMFVLHKFYPRTRPQRFVNWENVDGTCVPVSVDSDVYAGITAKFLQIYDGRLTSKDDNTIISPADMAKQFSAAIYQSDMSEYFASSYWAGTEKFLTDALDAQLKVADEKDEFPWFVERWMHPTMMVLPHLSMTHCSLDGQLQQDVEDATRYPLLTRVLQSTGDMEMCMFFEDRINMLEKTDLITANASTDPIPTSNSSVADRNTAAPIEGPDRSGDGTDHKERAETTAVPESGAREFSEGQIRGTAAMASDLGKDPQGVQVASTGEDVNKVLPKGSSAPENKDLDNSLRTPHVVENAIRQADKTTGAASDQRAASLAKENLAGSVKAQPTTLAGEPASVDTAAQPHPAGKPNSADDDKRKTRKYGVIEDGKWADIIEIKDGDTVPDGYVPCGDAKLGDKAE